MYVDATQARMASTDIKLSEVYESLNHAKVLAMERWDCLRVPSTDQPRRTEESIRSGSLQFTPTLNHVPACPFR